MFRTHLGALTGQGQAPSFRPVFPRKPPFRMNVVVVESPAKAKTINKYLGKDYTVLASYGHIRDLPPKDGSVKPDDDFAMAWEIDPKSSKHVKAIADAMKDADHLILATDPDREGEAISWHVLEALNQKKALKGKTVNRVTFNAITKPAVLAAMAAPRAIDMELVDAYLARRALDYLVGFTLSPVLWRPGACNRWRCASSSTAKSRSKSSSRKNTGPSTQRSRACATKASPRDSRRSKARS